MKFVLLDLDTSFFTRPEDLDRTYGAVWGKVPVHFGVAPFHAGQGVYVPAGTDTSRRHAVSDNRALVDFIRSRMDAGQARVFMHGFDHAPRGGRPEFSSPAEAGDRIRRGRSALEETFRRPVRVFLPPNGGLCPEAMAALRRGGMHVVGRFSFNPLRAERDCRPENLWNFARRQVFMRRHRDLPFPWVLRTAGMGELDCMWLMPGDTVEKLRDVAERLRPTRGTFCLATHYWELDRDARLKMVLLRFLDLLAEGDGMRFPPLEALFTSVS